jgi:hypothetical protein
MRLTFNFRSNYSNVIFSCIVNGLWYSYKGAQGVISDMAGDCTWIYLKKIQFYDLYTFRSTGFTYKVLIRKSIIRIIWIIRIFVFIWKASWYSNKYKRIKCIDLLLSVHPVWPLSTNSIILAIKSVSWTGHSFVGLISVNPTKLINLSHVYESKGFKLNGQFFLVWIYFWGSPPIWSVHINLN